MRVTIVEDSGTHADAWRCLPCELGTYGRSIYDENRTLNDTCAPCPAGFFGYEPGTTLAEDGCWPCPVGTSARGVAGLLHASDSRN